jgi:hypothetical protein
MWSRAAFGVAALEFPRIVADQGRMRRALLLSLLVLAAAAPASAAAPSFSLTPPSAHYLAVDHSLWIKAAWTPPTLATDVTVVVQQGTHTLRTLRAKRWLIGTKTFTLSLPKSLTPGTALFVQVRASSSAGSAQKTVSVSLQ